MTAASLVKLRAPGAKRWVFWAGAGTTNLRVHAVQIAAPARAQEIARELEASNPGWSAKVVSA